MSEVIQDKTLYYGDCLGWMQRFRDEQVDLIYLDPPFNSKANYNILFGQKKSGGGGAQRAQVMAFTDIWQWDGASKERVEDIINAVGHPAKEIIEGLYKTLGESGMVSYLSFMAERLMVMEKLLKKTGSIYLHCDPNASHYLKAVMDAIFGAENFRNEIIWLRRQDKHNLGVQQMGRAHDCILWYAKSEDTKYNIQYTPYEDDYLKRAYNKRDSRGVYRTLPCTNESGGNRPYEFRGITRAWRFKRERMEQLYQDDMLVQATPKSPFQYKKYLDSAKGVKVQDVWTDIKGARGKEHTRYPTQKPVALLERIIKASSNEGDLVLDPFAGCGTTIVAAHNLGRRWAGIDISTLAVGFVKDIRLKPLGIDVEVKGSPADFASAKKLADKPLEFERWAVQRIEGMVPNDKQVGDRGIDGRGIADIEPPGLVLAQVKTRYELRSLRDFIGVVRRDNAQFGIYITLDKVSSPNAHAEAAGLGKLTVGASKYQRVQLWSIEEHFDDRKPDLPVLKDPHTGQSMRRSIRMSGL